MNLPGGEALHYDSSIKFGSSPRRISTFTKESKIFGETHYYADPIMYSFDELAQATKWCFETFGEPGYNQNTMKTTWNYSNEYGYLFWFGEEKYLMLFLLRWS